MHYYKKAPIQKGHFNIKKNIGALFVNHQFKKNILINKDILEHYYTNHQFKGTF